MILRSTRSSALAQKARSNVQTRLLYAMARRQKILGSSSTVSGRKASVINVQTGILSTMARQRKVSGMPMANHNIDKLLMKLKTLKRGSGRLNDNMADPLLPVVKDIKDRQAEFVVSLGEIFKTLPGKDLIGTISSLEVPEEIKSTTIAVIGETGAGKSSLINALLNTTIAPTSLASSCTTVPTELCYRRSGGEKFVAEVEYMTWPEAEENMKTLCQRIKHFEIEMEGKIQSSEDEALESEAKVAESKIKALVPDFELEDLDNVVPMVKYLYDHNALLGNSKQTISAVNEEEFAEQIQDLLKNNTSFDGAAGAAQLWPLVKRVRIYLDSQLLQNGIVLVDLPGSNDENAARSAMARSYLPKVDDVIVVAPYMRILSSSILQSTAALSLQYQMEFNGRKRLILATTKTDMLRGMDDRELRNELCTLLPIFKKQLNDLKSGRKAALHRGDHDLVAIYDDEIRALTLKTRDEQVPLVIEERFKKMFGAEKLWFKGFMVCSKVYQNADDTDVKEQTQIPALSRFLSNIALEKRAIGLKNYLERFRREVHLLQNALEAWEAKFSDEARKELRDCVSKCVENLEAELNSARQTAIESMGSMLGEFSAVLSEVMVGAGEKVRMKHDEFFESKYMNYKQRKALYVREGEAYNLKTGTLHLNKFLISFIPEDLKNKQGDFSSLEKIVQEHQHQVEKALSKFRKAIIKCFVNKSVKSSAIGKFVNSKIKSIEPLSQRCVVDIRKNEREIVGVLIDTSGVRSDLQNAFREAASCSGEGATRKMKEIVEANLPPTGALENMKTKTQQLLDRIIEKYTHTIETDLKDTMEDVKKMTSAWYTDSKNQADPGKESRQETRTMLEEAINSSIQNDAELDRFIEDLDTFDSRNK